MRKHGVRIKLHSQPFQVLLMLLERPAEVVTREEMRQRLWGADTFVDFDHGLNSAVNKIRDALGDSASRPRYLETVSGKGYRFIAPVSLGAAAPASISAEAAQETAAARGTVLSTPEELPAVPRKRVRLLLMLVQALYLGFYLTALANLREVEGLFVKARLLPPAVLVIVIGDHGGRADSGAAVSGGGSGVRTPPPSLEIHAHISGFAGSRSPLGFVALPSSALHQHRPGAGPDRRAGVPAVRAALAGADVRKAWKRDGARMNRKCTERPAYLSGSAKATMFWPAATAMYCF